MALPEGTKRMQKRLFRFCRDQSGAVTVDWVILTAAIVGIGMIVLVPIAYTTDSSAAAVGGVVMNAPVGYSAIAP